jgi:plastocyanin
MERGRSKRLKSLLITTALLLPVIFLVSNVIKAEVEVKVRNNVFIPRDITIPMGETVKWVWEEGFHTTTSGTGSADPQAGALWDEFITSSDTTFSFQFNDEGVFPYFCIPHESLDMKGTVTVEAPAGVGDDTGKNSGPFPRSVDISQNYPNPFNPSTTFTVRIPEGEHTASSLRIFNLRGALVKTVFSERLPGGEYDFAWDGKSDEGENLSSGIYIYRLEYGDQIITKKMTMLK